MIKKLISKLYYKYCFKESDLAKDFIMYYIPGYMKEEMPAGTYVALKLNKVMSTAEPVIEWKKIEKKEFKDVINYIEV